MSSTKVRSSSSGAGKGGRLPISARVWASWSPACCCKASGVAAGSPRHEPQLAGKSRPQASATAAAPNTICPAR